MPLSIIRVWLDGRLTKGKILTVFSIDSLDFITIQLAWVSEATVYFHRWSVSESIVCPSVHPSSVVHLLNQLTLILLAF